LSPANHNEKSFVRLAVGKYIKYEETFFYFNIFILSFCDTLYEKET